MTKYMARLCFIFTFFVFFMFPLSNAAVSAKDDAINKAFAEVKTEDEAAGQENPELKYRQTLKEAITERPEEFKHEVDAYSRFIPSAGAKSQSGSVSIIDNQAEYSVDFKAFGKLPVAIGLGTRYIGVNNTTAVKLPARLTGINFGLETTLPFFNVKNTYFRMGIAPSFYGDRWNMSSRNFRLPSRAFWIYQPNEKFTAIAGVAINIDSAEAFAPIVGIIYKPNDKLLFNLIPTRPYISYQLTEKLSALAEMGFSSDEFYVTQNGRKNTRLDYNEYHGGLGFSYDFNKNISATFLGGMVMGRSLRYSPDSDGKVAIKNAPFVELQFSVGM